MRRLSLSVAVLAAVLLAAPAVTHAADTPVLSAPAVTNAPAGPSLSWTDTQLLPVTYRVFRAPGSCASPGGFGQVGADLDSATHAFADAGAPNGVHCYYVTADDG